MQQALELADINLRILKGLPHWRGLELIAEVRKKYEKRVWEQLEFDFNKPIK